MDPGERNTAVDGGRRTKNIRKISRNIIKILLTFLAIFLFIFCIHHHYAKGSTYQHRTLLSAFLWSAVLIRDIQLNIFIICFFYSLLIYLLSFCPLIKLSLLLNDLMNNMIGKDVFNYLQVSFSIITSSVVNHVKISGFFQKILVNFKRFIGR